MNAAMIIRATIQTETPQKTAEAFRFALAVSRGYTSKIIRAGAARIVLASDGQAVRFERAVALAEAA